MTEEENPYAPPISSNDDCTFDGNITTQSLRYLNRTGKLAIFVAIFSFIYVISSILLTLLLETKLEKILSNLFHILIALSVCWYSWQYAQFAKKVQNNKKTNNLLECFSYSTKIHKVFGIYSIILLSVFGVLLVVIFVFLLLMRLKVI